MAKQTFEANGRWLGSRQIESFRKIPGFPIVVQYSYAYFCPRCGDIWSRLWHEDSSHWQLIHRYCQEHGDGRLSLEFPSCEPLGIEKDWPRDALRREFLLELERAEKG